MHGTLLWFETALCVSEHAWQVTTGVQRHTNLGSALLTPELNPSARKHLDGMVHTFARACKVHLPDQQSGWRGETAIVVQNVPWMIWLLPKVTSGSLISWAEMRRLGHVTMFTLALLNSSMTANGAASASTLILIQPKPRYLRM